jgi:hypothetical protein
MKPRFRCALRGLASLESRIAPATLLNSETFTYQDTDGDDVTVHISKPLFNSATINAVLQFDVGATNGTKAAPDNGTPQQFRKLDFTALGVPSTANGVSISIGAKKDRVTGGDGFANVGYINATGIDLGAVTVGGDLDKIVAGNGIGTKPGLASLRAQSLGVNNIFIGAPDLVDAITGKLGALNVKGDVAGVDVTVSTSIGTISIGGSLRGGGLEFGGEISSTGNMGPVKVGKDILGDAGEFSGGINSGAQLASVTVGGSLLGGSNEFSGEIVSTGNMGPVRISKDVVGGAGKFSGGVNTSARLASVSIGGSLLGGSNEFSGEIDATGLIGPVKIGDNMTGGAGEFSGEINTNTILTSLTIVGSLMGGSNDFSGQVNSANIGPVSVGKDVVGGAGEFSGAVDVTGDFKSAIIGGSLIGGSNEESGAIVAGGNLGLVRIGKNIQGGTSSFTSYVNASRIAGVTVGGSIIAGPISGSYDQDGWICAEKDLGFVLVKGSVVGNGINHVVISAGGAVQPTATSDVAIARITVDGTMAFAEVRGGYNSKQSFVDSHAQIGSVTVVGAWTANRISSGAAAGADGTPGTADDTFPGMSKIGSIVIKGAISGNSSFAIDAGKIVSLTIDGIKEPLTNGADSLSLAGGSLPVFDTR